MEWISDICAIFNRLSREGHTDGEISLDAEIEEGEVEEGPSEQGGGAESKNAESGDADEGILRKGRMRRGRMMRGRLRAKTLWTMNIYHPINSTWPNSLLDPITSKS